MCVFSQKKFIILLIKIFILFGLNGCKTIVKPHPKWYPAKELKITKKDFKDLEVELICGEGSFNKKKWQKSSHKACKDLMLNFENLGVKVLKKNNLISHQNHIDSEKTKLSITFIDRGVSSDYGGWTLIPFVFSLGLYFPLVIDNIMKAEILISDNQNNLLKKEIITAESTEFIGYPALLFYSTSHKRALVEQTMELAAITYVLNLTQNELVKKSERI